jgi:hypothetical protein
MTSLTLTIRDLPIRMGFTGFATCETAAGCIVGCNVQSSRISTR